MKFSSGDGKMAQRLRTFATLAEDRVIPKNPHDGLQLSIIVIPGDLTPCFDFDEH